MVVLNLLRQEPHCIVVLEACENGVNPKTMVTARVFDRQGLREFHHVFESLDEALAYAHALYQAA